MKNCKKYVACLLILVLTLGAFCGCIKKTGDGSDTDEKTYAELTIGLPFDENSSCWSDLQTMIKDFEEMNDAKVTLVTVPQVGTDEYKDFIKKVGNNKIDMFYSAGNDALDDLADDGTIMTATVMNGKDSRISESLLGFFKKLRVEADGACYMIPVNAEYQGIFYNKDVFQKAGVAVPTDWNGLMSAIAALKGKSVTPFAAGFSDGGQYWMDELIMSEGGIAEHSTMPSKGIITSWQRALNDLVNVYKAGAFSSSALDMTHADAVAAFLNKESAMIVCSSKDMAGIDDENIGFMLMPVPAGGQRKANTVVAKATGGFYFNTKAMNRAVDDSTSLSFVMIEFLNSYVANSDYYTAIFAEAGTLPVHKSLSDAVSGSPATAGYAVFKAAEHADMPISERMITFDSFVSGLKDVLDGTVKAADYLENVSNAEVKAQNEKFEALKDK